MKNLKDIIIERLHINKDTKVFDYEETYGIGELKSFKDCNIYLLDNNQTSRKLGVQIIIPDVKDEIDKYFKNEDLVYEVIDNLRSGDIHLSKTMKNELANNTRPILQKVSLKQQQGYLLRELPDKTMVLVIKYFYKAGKLKKLKYIFKV